MAEQTEQKPVEAPTPAPETATNNETSSSEEKSAFSPDIVKFSKDLESIVKEAGDANEIYGVKLTRGENRVDIATSIILQKFLNANEGDLTKAKAQLLEALKWRKDMNAAGLPDERYNPEKFKGLGYVTDYKTKEGVLIVWTWNIYGTVKNPDLTFGDVKEFIRWRAGLMELAIRRLNIAAATRPISSSNDPYKMVQVHDYQSIKFFSMNPNIKAASKETITVFGRVYPELLLEKYFVNVPAIMGFMYGVIKRFISPATARKFHPMGSGANLAREFEYGDQLPKEYGGKGETLEKGGNKVLLDEPLDVE